MPGCVLDESMEPSKVMPGSSVIVEEEEALVRPKEQVLHTCWTQYENFKTYNPGVADPHKPGNTTSVNLFPAMK